MTESVRRVVLGTTLLALLTLGVALRLFQWREAPPGPWIDEALALRAARSAAATGAPLVGTTPLQPPDAGFVNFWVTNLALRAISAIDRGAGGGIASVRAISIGPSLLLLLGAAALAAQASLGRPLPLLSACALLSTSSWLLSTGRWGWLAVMTSGIAVLATAAALRAGHRFSRGWAATAGGLLGLSAWGYPAAWALVPLPFLVLAGAWRRDRAEGTGPRLFPVAVAGLAGWLLVTAPLAVHYAGHPERALARTRELSATRDGSSPLSALSRNAVSYAKLFVVGGDPNERHGDPERPVLPAAVTGLALAGAADGLRRRGAARLLAAIAGLLLVASLLAVEESANAFRTSLAAPFLIVLSALGAERLAGALGPARQTFAAAAITLVLAVSALLDTAGFLRWLVSPRLYGAFGGPERDLADAVSAELSLRGPADVLLAPAAARNAFVVDALLQRPSSATPAIRQASSLGELRAVPSRDLLFADAATAERSSTPRALGAVPVAAGGALPGQPGWVLWRVPAVRAAERARAFLEGFPRIPAYGAGFLFVPEEGLYTFSSRGGVDARLDGGVVFDAARPAGALRARLAPGRHELAVLRLAPGAVLSITGPDGFVLPAP
ncbi:MAG: hypothetical protein IPP07_27120 [Holophagales bacterium]|nr:hypothetical protein [Holophagales bacterium]MBK9968337.1 hypothetical protein [Holophagales bacterium]